MQLYVVISSYGQWDDYSIGVSGIFETEPLANKAIEDIRAYYKSVKENEPFEVKEAKMMLDKDDLLPEDEDRFETIVFNWQHGELKDAYTYNDSWVNTYTLNENKATLK